MARSQGMLTLRDDGMMKVRAGLTSVEEVLRVVKQVHTWSGKGSEYHGMRPDGSEAWHVKLHKGWSGTEYRMCSRTKSTST